MMRRLSTKIKNRFSRNGSRDQKTLAAAPEEQNPVAHDAAAAASPSLAINLVNNLSSPVYAYVTGTGSDNKLFFLQADGKTLYSPASPATGSTPQNLTTDVAIPLSAGGTTTSLTIPTYLSGGRIWFSVNSKLTFFVNPGPSLVSPSINNATDPNQQVLWGFAELSFNAQQVFANVSAVDFVSLPVGMSLENQSGQVTTVPGLPADGLQQVATKLKAQAAADGQPWDKLVVSDTAGNPLRAMSPNSYMTIDPNAWSTYWTDYVNQVWTKYTNEDLTVNTQAAPGDVKGRVNTATGNIEFPDNNGSFQKPNAGDIWGCNSGPFDPSNKSQGALAVLPRLAAAFNRTILLAPSGDVQPNGILDPSQFYATSPTNHYSRIVHEVEGEGLGYAFAYDDVVGDGGKNVAGTVFDGAPKVLTVTVGGTK